MTDKIARKSADALEIAEHRRDAYLAVFSTELRRLLDAGMSEQVAEHLAHAHAGHTLELQDARLSAVQETINEALILADAAAKIPRKRGGNSKAARDRAAKEWLRAKWQTQGHLFPRANAKTSGSRSKTQFALFHAQNPMSEFRRDFPEQMGRITPETIAGWLKGLK
jgi:hypothetical protein